MNRRQGIQALIVGLGVVLFVQAAAARADACEIEVAVKGEPKAEYMIGDEVVFEVKVILTHRNCSMGIDATQYNARGLTLVGATKWKETSPGSYVRLLKTKVGESKDGAASLRVYRKCNREGGQDSLSIKVAR